MFPYMMGSGYVDVVTKDRITYERELEKAEKAGRHEAVKNFNQRLRDMINGCEKESGDYEGIWIENDIRDRLRSVCKILNEAKTVLDENISSLEKEK